MAALLDAMSNDGVRRLEIAGPAAAAVTERMAAAVTERMAAANLARRHAT